jgi:hypothetical protein
VTAGLPDLLEPFPTVTVVGLAKNAGKTTVVNHLLDRLDGRIGLASLGLDGEARDHLTGLPKPRITPPAGTLVATTEGLLGPGAAAVRRLPFRTAMGRVVIAAATGDEPVVVAGPVRLDELDEAVAALRAAGARRVLLEGALGRLGTAAPGRADAVVLAAGAAMAYGRSDYPTRLRLALDALDLPVDGEPAALEIRHAAGHERELADRIAAGGAGRVAIDGALTGSLLELLLRAGVQVRLVAPDPTHVLASPQQVARARRRGVEVRVRRPLRVVALTASPFHPDAELTADEAFAAVEAAAAGRWPVYDVVSERMTA